MTDEPVEIIVGNENDLLSDFHLKEIQIKFLPNVAFSQTNDSFPSDNRY